MKKKLIIIITSAVILAVALIAALLLVDRELELPKLKADDISKVYCEMFKDEGIRIDLDVEEFLAYYNQIYDLRDNKEGAGTTPDSKIVIELKDGEEISIFNSGDQFEVNFRENDGERHQYWGKQQEIANMLTHGFYRLK